MRSDCISTGKVQSAPPQFDRFEGFILRPSSVNPSLKLFLAQSHPRMHNRRWQVPHPIPGWQRHHVITRRGLLWEGTHVLRRLAHYDDDTGQREAYAWSLPWRSG